MSIVSIKAALRETLARYRDAVRCSWRLGHPWLMPDPAAAFQQNPDWQKDSNLALAASWIALLFALTLVAGLDLLLCVGDKTGIGDLLGAGAREEANKILDVWRQYGLLNPPWVPGLYLLCDIFLLVPAYVLAFGALARRLRHELVLDDNVLLLGWSSQSLICRGVLWLAIVDQVENVLGLLLLWEYLPELLYGVLAWTSRLKQWMLSALLLLLVYLFLEWFYNLSLARTKMRRAIVDIVWRSKYVLIGLIGYAMIAVVMDQSRDVLGGMAQAGFLPGLFAAVATLVSAWVLSQIAAMWPRIVCRLRSPESQIERHTQLRDKMIALPSLDDPLPGDAFAKWWARLLGALPILLLFWAGMRSAADAVIGGALKQGGDAGPAYGLLGLSLFTILLNLGWLAYRDHVGKQRENPCYYNCVDETGIRTEFQQYWTWQLPLVALVLYVFCRGLGSFLDNWPPLTYALISFAFGFWLALFGWLAQLELQRATPYVLLGAIFVGMLGYLGWTDNHLIRTEFGAGDIGLAWMAGFSSLLAFWLIVTLTYFVLSRDCWQQRFSRLQQSKRLATGARAALPFIGAALISFGSLLLLLHTADGFSRLPESIPATEARGIALDKALADWLDGLCRATPACRDSPPATAATSVAPNVAAPPTEPTAGNPTTPSRATRLPVWLVSAEGGGIRAGYWTARVLAEINARDPDFAAHTFALSGVSGGALGLAIWRACLDAKGAKRADDVRNCVEQLGNTDLLTPMVGAWLFEDVLARWLPVTMPWVGCAKPGCGFLSRGLWFERSIERGVPEMRRWLVGDRPQTHHHPYLLLNGTWVETGERAIASELLIDWNDFPSTRDQLAILGRDLPLATAAHNASRFPFANAIGAVRAAQARCSGRKPIDWRNGQPDSLTDEQAEPVICGHLADGGYVENSGTRTTLDLLAGLRRRLAASEISGLTATQRDWLRVHIEPRVIIIRNGLPARPTNTVSASGAANQETGDPLCRDESTADVTLNDPGKPRCTGNFKLYTDFLGPVVGAANSIGTGSQARHSEAALERQVRLFYEERSRQTNRPVLRMDQTDDGTLYPLGWYLSPTVRVGLRDQASKVVNVAFPTPLHP